MTLEPRDENQRTDIAKEEVGDSVTGGVAESSGQKHYLSFDPDMGTQTGMFPDFFPSGLLLLDRNGRIAEANQALCRLLGCSRQSLMGRGISKFIDAASAQRYRSLMKDFEEGLLTPGFDGVEITLRSVDGSKIPVMLRVSAAGSEPGVRWLSIADLTAEKEIVKTRNEKIRQLEFISEAITAINLCETVDEIYHEIHERFGALLKNEIVCLSSYGKEDDSIGIIKVSKIGKQLRSIEKIIGVPIFKRVTYETFRKGNPDVNIEAPRLVRLTFGLYDFTARQISKTAASTLEKLLGLQHCYSIGFVWNNKLYGGLSFLCRNEIQPDMVQIIETVISNASVSLSRKWYQEELSATNENYNRILNTTNEGVWMVDDQFYTTYVNNVVSELLGYEPREMIGRRVYDFISADDLNEVLIRTKERASGKSSSYEIRYLTRSGKEMWFFQTAVPLFDNHSRFKGAFAMLTDITQRKKAEKELREREQFYRNLIEKQGEGIAIVDENEYFVFYNPVAEEIFGMEKGTLLGRNLREYTIEEDYQRILQQTEMRKSGITSTYELQIRLHSGEIRHLLVTANPQFDSSGGFMGSFGVFRDITMRIRLQKMLQTSEQRLQSIMDNSPDLIIRMNREMRVEFVNSAIRKQFGVEPMVCIGQVMDISADHHIFLSCWYQDVLRVFETGTEVQGEFFTIVAGVQKYFSYRLVPENHENKVNSVLSIIRDETARQVAENALRDSELMYRQLFENAQFGISYFTEDGRILLINDAGARQFGMAASDLEKKNIAEVCDPARAAVIIGRIGQASESSEGFFAEDVFNTGSEFRTYYSCYQPLFNDKGTFKGVQIITSDISTQKEAEEKVRTINQDLERRVSERTAMLEAANRDLESFSYSVSHDLRTPLRSIDGFSRILMEDYQEKLDEEGRRLIQVVLTNVRKMGRLIDDLLEFAQIGRRDLMRKKIDMRLLALSVTNEVLEQFPNREQIDIQVGNLPEAWADERYVGQVLQNLIENAVKYSLPKHRVTVEVGCHQNGEKVYYVRDRGIGFDMKYYNKLFQVFQRLHRVDEIDGSGVGLAIVSQIISRHGGRIWAESTEGKGSVFYFTLPRDVNH